VRAIAIKQVHERLGSRDRTALGNPDGQLSTR
jgi:hypothetical protein